MQANPSELFHLPTETSSLMRVALITTILEMEITSMMLRKEASLLLVLLVSRTSSDPKSLLPLLNATKLVSLLEWLLEIT